MRWYFSMIRSLIDSTFHLSNRIFEGKLRFIPPVIFIAAAKVVGAVFLYQRLSQALGHFYTPFMAIWGNTGPTCDWIYLFSAQDTSFYVNIASSGYRYPEYVFFPAYPALCRAAGIITGDFWFSAFIVSFIFGLGSIPLFQLVSEHYMSRTDAAISTLLAMTFPYIFLFTTVSYTESLFLFSTLLSWHLYIRERYVPSAFAVTLATLTKTFGIAIAIPIIIGLLSKRKPRNLLPLLLPVLALLGWMFYLYSATGDAIAFSTQQQYWDIQLGNKFGWISNYMMPFLDFAFYSAHTIPEFNYLEAGLIIFVAYLVFNIYRLDVKLGIYSILMFLGLLYFGNFISFPRYFAFIFPLWLIVGGKVRNVFLLIVALGFFIIFSLMLWSQFIMAIWVS